MPKNILMIGPTGVGKTEIARRLAKLANAPFIKVEASKFTEVGYVGRDVESIIRDLMDFAMKMTRAQALERVQHLADEAAEERVLDILLKPAKEGEVVEDTAARKSFRKQLREGGLDSKEIEINIASGSIGVEIMAPPGMEEMTSQLQGMFQSLSSERKRYRKLKIKEAMKFLREEEASKLIDEEHIRDLAVRNVEQNGMVFIDEIDKITRSAEVKGADVSREGVQRDLLPLVEGCAVMTKYGMVNTDHILFIASGAFHMSKPSDLIPELQGRLPIRVTLKPLTVEDFVRILTEPNASLTKQYTALLGVENVTLKFNPTGVKRIAQVAFDVNDRLENIGARRLHTVIERLLEKISFDASDTARKPVIVDKAYVDLHLKEVLLKSEDLTQYIL